MVKQLALDPDNNIFVTSRAKHLNTERISYIMGNARENSFIEPLLSNHYDVIIDFMTYKTEEFAARYRKICDNTGQYVYLSSSRVYADSDKPIKEDSPRLLDVYF